MKDNFLERIRSGDEGVKRKWVFIFSAIAAAITIILWGIYMNALFVNLGQREVAGRGGERRESLPSKPESGERKGSLWDSFSSFREALKEPRSYIIR